MKNIDRYKADIYTALLTDMCCEFIRNKVLNGDCENVDCDECAKRVRAWMLEDEGEPMEFARGLYCRVWDDNKGGAIVVKVIGYDESLERPYITICTWHDEDGTEHSGVGTWKHAEPIVND